MKIEIVIGDFILSGEYTEFCHRSIAGKCNIMGATNILVMDKKHKLLGKVDFHALRIALNSINECIREDY